MIPLVRAMGKRAATVAATPGDYPTGLTLWAKADAITGATNGSALPSGWVDSSGAGNTLNGGLPPTYITGAGKAGLPVVRFNGTSHWLASNAPAGDPEQTVLAVMKVTNTGALHGVRGTSANNGLYCRLTAAGNPDMVKDSVAGIATAGSSIGFGAWHVVIWTYSDSLDAYTMEVDGVNVGSGTTAQTLVAASTTVMGRYRAGSEYLGADMGEFASWSTVLSPSQRASLVAGLSAKWI